MSSTYVLVLYVLEELELTIRSLTQHWSTEGLHNLLNGNGRASELVL